MYSDFGCFLSIVIYLISFALLVCCSMMLLRHNDVQNVQNPDFGLG